MLTVLEYLDADGHSPFRAWFDDLDAVAAVKVRASLLRLEAGNLSNVKSVGKGMLELKIDFGPGYRIYFGRNGDTVIILLAGGTKVRQQNDIEAAHARWVDYKRRTRKRKD